VRCAGVSMYPASNPSLAGRPPCRRITTGRSLAAPRAIQMRFGARVAKPRLAGGPSSLPGCAAPPRTWPSPVDEPKPEAAGAPIDPATYPALPHLKSILASGIRSQLVARYPRRLSRSLRGGTLPQLGPFVHNTFRSTISYRYHSPAAPRPPPSAEKVSGACVDEAPGRDQMATIA